MKKIGLAILVSGLIGGYCINDYYSKNYNSQEHKLSIAYIRTGGMKPVEYMQFVLSNRDFVNETRINSRTTSEKRVQLTKEEYHNIDQLIHNANFFSLNATYKSEHRIFDAPYTILNAEEDNRKKTITIEAGANVPKGLDDVLQYLNKLEKEKFQN